MFPMWPSTSSTTPARQQRAQLSAQGFRFPILGQLCWPRFTLVDTVEFESKKPLPPVESPAILAARRIVLGRRRMRMLRFGLPFSCPELEPVAATSARFERARRVHAAATWPLFWGDEKITVRRQLVSTTMTPAGENLHEVWRSHVAVMRKWAARFLGRRGRCSRRMRLARRKHKSRRMQRRCIPCNRRTCVAPFIESYHGEPLDRMGGKDDRNLVRTHRLYLTPSMRHHARKMNTRKAAEASLTAKAPVVDPRAEFRPRSTALADFRRDALVPDMDVFLEHANADAAAADEALWRQSEFCSEFADARGYTFNLSDFIAVSVKKKMTQNKKS